MLFLTPSQQCKGTEHDSSYINACSIDSNKTITSVFMVLLSLHSHSEVQSAFIKWTTQFIWWMQTCARWLSTLVASQLTWGMSLPLGLCLLATPTIAIYYYCSAQKLILNLPPHGKLFWLVYKTENLHLDVLLCTCWKQKAGEEQ